MGGTGSGNYGGRPTVEAALKLDLHHLIRSGSFRPGATVTGSLAWTNNDTGEQRASIGYKAHMEDEHGWVRLTYATTNHWTGQTTQHDYTVELETTPQTFGGRRWWWVCPRRGDLVAKLYKPVGADGGIGDPIDKPKGMRWITFDRKLEQVEAAETVCDARLLRFVQKLVYCG
jgi:hypothetical protein